MFRVAHDLRKFGYAGDRARFEGDTARLKQQSLVSDKTIEVSGKKTLRVLTLTKTGRRPLGATNHLRDDQTLYHGLKKPREAKHDADLYRLYQKEAARITRAGGTPTRVILDYELKRDVNRDLAQLGKDKKDDPDARQKIAERHGLDVVDGRIPLPDLRIDYQTADMEIRGVDSRPTVRYFVDKFPMFLTAEVSSPVVTFTYVPEDELSLTDFIRHLREYSPLFRQLAQFRFIYIARTAVAFDKAQELFDSLVWIPLESNVTDDLLRYFRIRQAWEAKQYSTLTDADLVFRNQAKTRFRAGRFEAFYRGWKTGAVGDERIRIEFGGDRRTCTINFEAYQLKPPRATDNGNGADG